MGAVIPRAGALLCALGLVGCAIEPVQPWERGALADPLMVRDPGALHAGLEQHIYTSKEGTSGGYSVGAGGCGCN